MSLHLHTLIWVFRGSHAAHPMLLTGLSVEQPSTGQGGAQPRSHDRASGNHTAHQPALWHLEPSDHPEPFVCVLVQQCIRFILDKGAVLAVGTGRCETSLTARKALVRVQVRAERERERERERESHTLQV